ncbi:MprA protease, GlyGly-CTERM protein-sorting domain-containing form [Actinokineospora inagensis]|nr:MprA protease, GlyGly-CTERM protein-sorting domain-containing form [Actinokineospora inagensis]
MDVGLIAVVAGALLLVAGLVAFTRRRIKQQ